MSSQPSLFQRSAVLAYGLIAYAFTLVVLVYFAGFLGGFLVPRPIDAPPTQGLGAALLTDALLVALFAVQHSVMARPAFKRWLGRFLPTAAERSTYVAASCAALIALFWFWAPIGGLVWEVAHPLGRTLLHFGYALGWLIVLATTFLINHFDLFGLRQIWRFFRRQSCPPLKFVTPGPYKLVRHPLYVGWIMTFWCTPRMGLAHLAFAGLTTAYILIAIRYEERDLVEAHGRDYVEYRNRTPMLVPALGREADPATPRA